VTVSDGDYIRESLDERTPDHDHLRLENEAIALLARCTEGPR